MPLLVLAYLSFVSLALPDSLIGVAWPPMRASLGQPVSALGLLPPVGVAAYLVSSTATGFVLARTGMGWLLAGSTALSAAALAGFGLASRFWAVVGAIGLLGLGSGAIDAGLNAHAARRFGARHISWMHAAYGLGAATGPLVVVATIGAGRSWRWAFAAVAATQAVLAAAFALTARRWEDRAPGPRRGRATGAPRQVRRGRGRHPLRLGAVWQGAAAFAVQTGIESAAPLWAVVYLTGGRGLPAAPAGMTVAGYWAAMCAGRLVLGPLAERVGAWPVLTGGVTGVAGGALLVTLPGPAWQAVAGLVVVGFAAAPVFPLLTLTTADRVGGAHADTTVGVQVAASSLGAAAIPALVGTLIGTFGPPALAPSLLVLALTMALIYRRLRPTPPPAPEPAQ